MNGAIAGGKDRMKKRLKTPSTNSEGQWSWGQNLVDLLFSLPLTPGCDVPESYASESMKLMII